MQAVYGWEVNPQPAKDVLEFGWLTGEERRKFKQETVAFAVLLVAGTLEKIKEIDENIIRHLIDWDFKRLARVDLAVMRVSVFSLLYQKTIPASVIIDEAIEIARKFSADDAPRFINGVLDGILKNQNA